MYLRLSTVWLLSFQLLAGLVLICWPNKPCIFHEAVRLGNENTQALINWLIEWIRLDTALKVSDAPFPLPFSPLLCLEKAGSRRAMGDTQLPSEGRTLPRHLLVLASPTVPQRESLAMSWAVSKFSTNPTSGSLDFRQTHHFQAWIPGHVKWL